MLKFGSEANWANNILGLHRVNIFYTLRVLQVKNIELLKEKNNPRLQNVLITIKLKMLFHLSLSHRASSSRNLFLCSLEIFQTADDINLLIRIAVAL